MFFAFCLTDFTPYCIKNTKMVILKHYLELLKCWYSTKFWTTNMSPTIRSKGKRDPNKHLVM